MQTHRWYTPIVIAIVALLTAVASGALRPLESAFVDVRTGWFEREPVNDVVIVEIDARTLRALTRWPWSRHIHAKVIERLNDARPRAVFFDVDFSSPSGDPSADSALASALAERRYQFVLPAFWQAAGAGATGGFVLTTPLSALAEHTAIGLVNVAPAADGLVRDMVHVDRFNGKTYRSAAALLANANGFDVGAAYPLDFRIAPTAFERISYLDVLDGATDKLRGKTVLVGATALELNDSVPVPNHRAIPGVVMQAIAYTTLRQGVPVAAPTWASLAMSLVVCFAAGVWARVSWRRTLIVTTCGIAVAMAAASALDGFWSYRLDVMPIVCALVLNALIGVALSADRQAVRAWLTGVRLERREALISSVLSASIDGILVFGRDGVIRDANRAASVLLRASHPNLQGENVRRLLPGLPAVESLGTNWARAIRGHSGNDGHRFEVSVGPARSATRRARTSRRSFATSPNGSNNRRS
jgi:CHASE2 domain-containing sensor protein